MAARPGEDASGLSGPARTRRGRPAATEGCEDASRGSGGAWCAPMGEMPVNPHCILPALRPAGPQSAFASPAALHVLLVRLHPAAASHAARRRQERLTTLYNPPHRGSGHGGGETPRPLVRLRVGHAPLDGRGNFPPPSIPSPTVPPNQRHHARWAGALAVSGADALVPRWRRICTTVTSIAIYDGARIVSRAGDGPRAARSLCPRARGVHMSGVRLTAIPRQPVLTPGPATPAKPAMPPSRRRTSRSRCTKRQPKQRKGSFR